MAQPDLYMRIKQYITKNIYEGVYREGDKLPSERSLSEDLGVSRVTIRKALQELEKEHLLQREVGSGTRIYYSNKGHKEELDSICLVAKARNPFFSEFIAELQKKLDREGILLIYVQKSKQETLEDCMYRLYQKGLNNIVVWPEDQQLAMEKLQRLRAIGMNMTFFDTDLYTPYGDCIIMDNEEAMQRLMCRCRADHCQRSCYLGWDNQAIPGVRQREEAARQYGGDELQVLRVPWQEKRNIEPVVQKYLNMAAGSPAADRQEETCIICGDGEIGLTAARLSQAVGYQNARLFSIDEFSFSDSLKLTTIGQDFKKSAELVLESLILQSTQSEVWRARVLKVPGRPLHAPERDRNILKENEK